MKKLLLLSVTLALCACGGTVVSTDSVDADGGVAKASLPGEILHTPSPTDTTEPVAVGGY